MSDTIFNALSNLLAVAPVLLVWLAGIVLAIIRWQRHPRVSLITVIAISLLLVEMIIGTLLNIQIPLMLSEQGWSAADIGTFFLVKGFIQAVIAAIAYGLLLFALFSGRNSESSATL